MEFSAMVETRGGDVAMTFHVPEYREAEQIAAQMGCSFSRLGDARAYARKELPYASEQMLDDVAWALVSVP